MALTNLDPDTLNKLERLQGNIFKGYSMYEVDGVFSFMESSGSGMPRPHFAEERTQIIRIFFLPDFTKMLEDVNEGTETEVTMDALINFCDLFFNMTSTTASDAKSIYLRLEPYISNPARLAEIGPLTAAQATVLRESLKLWVNAGIFFCIRLRHP